jgi:hypothetical protein
MERLKELSTACEKQEVYYKTMISTHEVTIGQQAIYIGEFEKARIDSKKLERQVQLTMVNPLETAQEMVADNVNTILHLQKEIEELQEVVSGNVNTILHLQEQLKEMDEYAQEGWDLAETYRLEIQNLETDIHTLEINGGDSDMWDTKASGRGMVEYPFNPEGETPDTPTDVSAIYRPSLLSSIREKYPSALKPATEDTLFPGNATPEPYPYTSPVREVPVSGRVKVKN